MKISTLLKIILGYIALFLGIIGLVIPVWPTTPFVLLAVGCFSATPKMQEKILKISFVREYYESYTKGIPIKKRTATTSLVFLWAMLTLSIFLTRNLLVVFTLLAVGICVTIHILWIARKKKKV